MCCIQKQNEKAMLKMINSTTYLLSHVYVKMYKLIQKKTHERYAMYDSFSHYLALTRTRFLYDLSLHLYLLLILFVSSLFLLYRSRVLHSTSCIVHCALVCVCVCCFNYVRYYTELKWCNNSAVFMRARQNKKKTRKKEQKER